MVSTEGFPFNILQPIQLFLYFPEVTVDMSFHTQLGLDVDWANGKSLYVRHLQGSGAVEEWNRQHLGVERWSFGHHHDNLSGTFFGPAGFLEDVVTLW